MKSLTCVLLLSVCGNLYSQNKDLPYELEKILADVPNEFINITAPIKRIESLNDTIFFSKSGISGVLRNEIVSKNEERKSRYFMATIDSVSQNKGKKMIEKWRKELIRVLGDSYKSRPVNLDWGKGVGVAKGVMIENGKISIVLLSTYPSSNTIGSKLYLTIQRAGSDH